MNIRPTTRRVVASIIAFFILLFLYYLTHISTELDQNGKTVILLSSLGSALLGAALVYALISSVRH